MEHKEKIEMGASGTAENVTLRLVQVEALEVSHWRDWSNWRSCERHIEIWATGTAEWPEIGATGKLGTVLKCYNI